MIASDATVGNSSGAMRVTGSGDGKSLVQSGIKVPSSGYAFVYVSNTSSTNVYFDNLKIIHERGRILQEHHYYPYGLEIANISSKAFGKLDNGWRYQGTFSEFEEETGWTNFDLRNYDAQLGRWTSVDPYDQYASGYVGMGGNPVSGVDEDGGGYFGINWLNLPAGAEMTIGQIALSRAINTAACAVAGGLGNMALKGWNLRNFGSGALVGGGVGLAATYVPWGNIDSWLGALTSEAVNAFVDIVRTSQQKDERIINRTLNDLDKRLDEILSNLLTWDQQHKDNFREHFGADDDASRNTIKDLIIKTSRQVHQYQSNPDNNKIERTNNQPPGTFAYVYPNDILRHTMHLEKQFWKARRKGRDSKLGTFAHEISHFNDVGRTSDNGYGTSNARNLTNSPNGPGAALNNADNFEYFIEKTKL